VSDLSSAPPSPSPTEVRPSRDFWENWAFLGVLTVAISAFLPLAFFAPVPLGMANLVYGRKRGLLFGGGCLMILSLLCAYAHLPLTLPALFVISLINGFIISEIIYRRINPVKGVIRVGLSIVMIITMVTLAVKLLGGSEWQAQFQQGLSLSIQKIVKENAEIFSQNTEESKAMKEMLEKPQEIIAQFMQVVPVIVFAVFFLELWSSFFILLRNSFPWRKKVVYPFAVRHLIHFRVPDFFIWLLIVGLTFSLTGSYFKPWGEIVGYNILYALGLFYFFQGLGVYLDMLNFFKIFGIIRPLLVMITVFWAWRFLVVVGVFDVWINFRKFLKNKNQGDLV
jgi:hypothetical protein